MRSLIARCLGAATIAAALAFAGIALYGGVRGPVAPIHARGGQFRDRLGNRYTAEQYAAFVQWERLFMGAGAAVFLFGFAFGAVSGQGGRKPGELTPEEAEVLGAVTGHLERSLPGIAAELRALNRVKPPGAAGEPTSRRPGV